MMRKTTGAPAEEAGVRKLPEPDNSTDAAGKGSPGGRPQLFRGLLYDVVQGRTYDPIRSLYPLVSFASECGLNELVLYLDQMYSLKSHPALAYEYSYKMDELVELADFARSLGVGMMPSITTLGHSGAKLSRPGYSHLAFPRGGDFDVFNPDVYRLFEGIFDEVLPLFPSRYAFINGDETSYCRLSPRAEEEARIKGLGHLYGTAMGRLARMIIERGRRPIIWHDMLLHHPESIEYIPRRTVIAYWYYDVQEHPAVEYFCGLGFDVIGCPGILGDPAVPALARGMPNIRLMAQAVSRNSGCADGKGRALGTMLTVWCGIPWTSALPAIYAAGRWTHNPEIPQEEIERQFPERVFGAGCPMMAHAVSAASAEARRTALVKEAMEAAGGGASQALSAELGRREALLNDHVSRIIGEKVERNRELYDAVCAFAGRLLKIKPSPHQNRNLPRELYCAKLAGSAAKGCTYYRGRTEFGHDLVIISNGVVAVALLPDFAAAMIEWTILGEKPWSALMTKYEEWASRERRIPGYVGLGSPWGAAGILGWRETVFFNSRLNPCTLWGRPFDVSVERNDAGRIEVSCAGRNETAEIRRTVCLNEGENAIHLESSLIPLRDGWFAIRPNCAHSIPDTPIPLLLLEGDTASAGRERSLIDTDTLHLRPDSGRLRVCSPLNNHSLGVEFKPDEVDGFLTDFGNDLFTVEPLGRISRHDGRRPISLTLKYTLG